MFSRRSPAVIRNDNGVANADEMSNSHATNNTNNNNPSLAGSIALTLVSTIADGLHHSIAHWKVLLLGQAVSLILAIAGATNEVLATECKVSAPSLYNACGFFLVSIFGGIQLYRETRRSKLNIANHQGVNTLQLSEEQESLSVQQQQQDDGIIEEEDDDELTIEDDETSIKRSIFSSLRGRNNNNVVKRQSNSSNGSDSKLSRLKYPFCFGLFTIHAKWYYYFAVALIEAQAYYFIFLAFRYTSFAFVYVSDALAIPSAMIFTKLFMKRSYRWSHIVGCAICLFGIVLNTASDMKKGGDEEDDDISSGDHIKGDIFAILGAVLLGLDDVLSEMIIDFGGVNEMLFMKGLFGSLISLVQMTILERDAVYALFTVDGSSCELEWRMILFGAHVLTRGLDVAGEMTFLAVSEAALLNILLLTSDLYAALFDVIAFGIRLTPYFYGGFVCIVIGIVLYEAAPSPAEQPINVSTPMAIEFKHPQGKKKDDANVEMTQTEHTSHLSSSVITQHAANLSPNLDGKLT